MALLAYLWILVEKRYLAGKIFRILSVITGVLEVISFEQSDFSCYYFCIALTYLTNPRYQSVLKWKH